MLYREIIAVCSQIHTKHIITLCGQSVEFVNVKPGGTYIDHWALEGQWPVEVVSIRTISLCSVLPSQPTNKAVCLTTEIRFHL